MKKQAKSSLGGMLESLLGCIKALSNYPERCFGSPHESHSSSLVEEEGRLTPSSLMCKQCEHPKTSSFHVHPTPFMCNQLLTFLHHQLLACCPHSHSCFFTLAHLALLDNISQVKA
ncbi:hypothetical protein V8G54_011780 [Vigna mungo]|uniref:Uncharacterized protein n=1 Tax=Vigna mungo TaxID=3915 RepID=A0AAQ3RZX9_VIGMU